ncbi:hypothetical protein FACS189461_5480 [Spirochaetia bacterium]|nr:hypothetical protein FACS189461_5480 [Spirochaetia bacterium]
MSLRKTQYAFLLVFAMLVSCEKKEQISVKNDTEISDEQVVTIEQAETVEQTETIEQDYEINAAPIPDYYKNAIIEYENFNKYLNLINIIEVNLGDKHNKYFLVSYKSATSAEDDAVYLYLFIFSNEKKMKGLIIGSNGYGFHPEIIMANIPGQFDDNLVAVGDYNNDGSNEILFLEFAGIGYTFYIWGIDHASLELITYCEIPFYSKYPPEFAPVEFIRYKGVKGFQIYTLSGWMFCKWDENEKKYVQVEKVEPEFIER